MRLALALLVLAAQEPPKETPTATLHLKFGGLSWGATWGSTIKGALKGLAGSKKVTGSDGEYDVVIETPKLPTVQDVRKAVPEKYSLDSFVLEAAGEVEKKDGDLRLKVDGTDRIVVLKKKDWIEEPYARLKRLYYDGQARFRLAGDLATGEKGWTLEVRTAEAAK